jgi:chromosome segregation ATPase
LQAQKLANTSEEQLALLQTKFAEIDNLLFEKTEKIMALESELKELQEAKQSLEEQNSRVDPAEIARKDIKIQKLEETLVRSG